MIVVPVKDAVCPTVCMTDETDESESAGIRDIRIACAGIVVAKAPPACSTSTRIISGLSIQPVTAGATKNSSVNAEKMQNEPPPVRENTEMHTADAKSWHNAMFCQQM